MKRFVSIVLALVLLLTGGIPVLSVSAAELSKAELVQAEVAKIQEEIPGAVVQVKNNIIHIAVQSPADIPGLQTMSRTTSVTNSNGGSYRSFIIPFAGDFNPYSQVFMSAKVANAVAFRFDYPDEATKIIQDIIDGVSYVVIASWVKNQETFEHLSDEEIDQIIEGLHYIAHTLLIELEHITFDTALRASSTGKVELVRGLTSSGLTQYFYYPWNSNTCATYGGYSATWFAGVYDV